MRSGHALSAPPPHPVVMFYLCLYSSCTELMTENAVQKTLPLLFVVLLHFSNPGSLVLEKSDDGAGQRATASNSITQLAAYLCNKLWEMWSWAPFPCTYKETRLMGDAENSWNRAELKELVLPSIPIQLSERVPPLWIGSSATGCLSFLCTAGLLLSVWQDLVAHSWQARFQVYQQILPAPSGNNATEWQASSFLWPRLLLQPLPAPWLFIDPIDFVCGCWYSPVAPLLPKQSLLGTECPSGPFPLGWWCLPGPSRASAGDKCVWQQAPRAAGHAVSPEVFQGQPVVSFIAEAGGDRGSTNRWLLVGQVPGEVVVLPGWQVNV